MTEKEEGIIHLYLILVHIIATTGEPGGTVLYFGICTRKNHL